MEYTFTASELFTRLKNRDNILLLDIRQVHQYKMWQFFGSINIPLDDLPRKIDKLPKDKEIVVICDRGNTSQQAAKTLHELGFKARILAGGLKAWNSVYEIVEVEPIRPLEYRIFQVQRLGKGCLSYVISDDEEKKAIIVDPTRHIHVYLDFLKNNQLSLSAVLDTHLHADHLSGARWLAKERKTLYLLPKSTSTSFSFLPIEEVLPKLLPMVEIEFEQTPGHTKESICINLDQAVIFTGDTLFLESVGRSDLGNTHEEDIRLLYETIVKKLFLLDDNIYVLPAHTQQTLVPNGSMQAATLRYIKRANDIVKSKSLKSFMRKVVKVAIPTPANFAKIKEINGNGLLLDEDLDELEFGANNCAVSL